MDFAAEAFEMYVDSIKAGGDNRVLKELFLDHQISCRDCENGTLYSHLPKNDETMGQRSFAFFQKKRDSNNVSLIFIGDRVVGVCPGKGYFESSPYTGYVERFSFMEGINGDIIGPVNIHCVTDMAEGLERSVVGDFPADGVITNITEHNRYREVDSRVDDILGRK